MEKYLRALSAFCLVIFFAGGVSEAQPKADVMMDVMVMQVDSERSEYLAATMASAGTAEDLLRAVLADSSTKMSQSAEVRAADGQKVTLRIGEKYPKATGSLQPSKGGVGLLLSTRSQLVDTGVNVELTPHVHGSDEVTLRVGVEVSRVANMVNLSGLNQPVIAQRRNEADVALWDGEVSILWEFHGTQDSNATIDIPRMVNVPALGEFLSGNGNAENYRQGLVIAVIPHIVRTSAIAP
jgi:general secretion pathway protein D